MKELPISSGILDIMGLPAKYWMRLFVSNEILELRERFVLDYKTEVQDFITPPVPGMFIWRNFPRISLFRDIDP
jgi:hypothetical protein